MSTKWTALLTALLAGACAKSDAPPPGDPSQPVRQGLRGRGYHADALADRDGQFFWVQTILSDYRPVREADFPARIETLQASNCLIPGPREGEVVRHVQIEQGAQQTPVYEISNAELTRKVESFVRTFVDYGRKSAAPGAEAHIDALHLMNVVVTETEAPVYLVLAAEDDTIFNIQAAPSATIARIVLVGGSAVGLVNAPVGAPVHAIFAKATRRCHNYPHREPKDDWSFVRNVKESASADSYDVLRKNIGHYRAYATWFEKTTGTAAGNSVTAMTLGGALIGTPPASSEARLPFKPLAGATLYLSRADHAFVATEKDYRARIGAMVTAAAEEAAGGVLQTTAGGR